MAIDEKAFVAALIAANSPDENYNIPAWRLKDALNAYEAAKIRQTFDQWWNAQPLEWRDDATPMAAAHAAWRAQGE